MSPADDPYARWLREFAALLRADLATPAAAFEGDRAGRPPAADAPCCLLLSPHPDDECIVGALALRLRREAGWRVVNAAVTLGSRIDRRPGRHAELVAACRRLDFELVLAAPDGLDGVTVEARRDDPGGWRAKVAAVQRLLREWQPRLVLLPHADDASATHRGVHALGCDAIEREGRPLAAAFTEYWSTLPAANLLVATSLDDTATLLRALSCHVGELARNPYHRRLPGWMADAVRRGGELVLGAGCVPPALDFATLYRLQHFSGSAWLPAEAGRILAADAALSTAALGLDV